MPLNKLRCTIPISGHIDSTLDVLFGVSQVGLSWVYVNQVAQLEVLLDVARVALIDILLDGPPPLV